MGHVVVHRDVRGQLQLEEASSLDDALTRVEALRNADGHDDVRVFEEVPLEVRTYYRVAVAAAPSHSPSPSTAAETEPAVAPEVAQPVAEPDVPRVAAVPDPEPEGHEAGADAALTSAHRDEPLDGPSDADLNALLSPFDAAPSAAGPDRTPAAEPPPGTFPLAGPPVPHAEPSTADDSGDAETSPLVGRRGPRFSRER